MKISICCSCYAWILCAPRLPEVTAALVFCICLVKGVNAQDSRARATHLVAGVVGAAEARILLNQSPNYKCLYRHLAPNPSKGKPNSNLN
jgi:hypothetical protein